VAPQVQPHYIVSVATKNVSQICAYFSPIRPSLTSQHADLPISFPYSN